MFPLIQSPPFHENSTVNDKIESYTANINQWL